MSIKEQIIAEVDARRQNMVYELYRLLDDSEKYIRVKGMHDAYVDMLAFLDTLPEQPELVQHPAIGYMYNADAGRGEQLKQAILALLKSDLIQVAGRGFTKTELIDWIETRPAEMKEDGE